MYLLKLYIFLNIIFFISIFSQANSHNETNKDFKFLVRSGYKPENPTLAKYAVSLRAVSNRPTIWGTTHFCGGSIYNARKIITAAHCIVRTRGRLSKILVVAGSPNRLQKTENTQERLVKRAIAHRRYSTRRTQNDIAVLILEEDLELDGVHVDAIELTKSPPVGGVTCTVVGWGMLYPGGFTPANIIYGDLELWPTSSCRRVARIVTKDMICAKNSDDYEVDSCYGDSGGPLICNNELTGVVSWGFDCGHPFFPGFYANVYYFRDWIEKNRAVTIYPSILLTLVFFWNMFLYVF